MTRLLNYFSENDNSKGKSKERTSTGAASVPSKSASPPPARRCSKIPATPPQLPPKSIGSKVTVAPPPLPKLKVPRKPKRKLADNPREIRKAVAEKRKNLAIKKALKTQTKVIFLLNWFSC